MSSNISDYINIKKRAVELDCNIPDLMCFIPRNFKNAKSKNELFHEMESSTLRILFRQNKLEETPLEKSDEKFPVISERFEDYILPSVFLSLNLISQNPEIINIIINIILSYLENFILKGILRKTVNIKFSFVIENKPNVYKKIDYEGPLEGIKEIKEVIKSVYDE